MSGGYNTEYPGVVFSLIFIAEYSLLLALITSCSIYFFGGSLFSYNGISLVILLIGVLIELRSTFPRYR